jgi:hypothetical protein
LLLLLLLLLMLMLMLLLWRKRLLRTGWLLRLNAGSRITTCEKGFLFPHIDTG